MTNLSVFRFNDQELRTFLLGDIPLFVAKDVALILGYSDTAQAIRQHIDPEDTLTDVELTKKANKSIQLNLRLKCYREAIQPQILEHWESITNKKCCICKTRFSLQVDHKTKSFVALVSEFEASYKPDKYPTMERCDSIQTIRFKRSKSEYVKFICEWQKFHRKNADFQLLCSTCNLKKQDGSRYKPYAIEPSAAPQGQPTPDSDRVYRSSYQLKDSSP